MAERKVIRVEDKKKAKPSVELKKLDIDKEELSELMDSLSGYLKTNPNAVKDLKKEPVQTIVEFLAYQKVSSATKEAVTKVVEDNSDGDILSTLGSLMLAGGKKKSTKKKEKDTLETITSLLGNESAGEALGSLLDAFGGKEKLPRKKKKATKKASTTKKTTTKKKTTKKKTSKKGDTLEQVLDLVGDLLK